MTQQDDTPQPVLTDEEIQDIADGFDIYGAKPEFARAIESALLSKLRAPVADPLAAFEAWSKNTNQGYDLTRMNSGKLATYESDLTEHAWRGYCHAALASSPVADERALPPLPAAWGSAINDAGDGHVDLYSAEQMQEYTRAALASVPVADESPMAKMAEALREKARQEQRAYQDRRDQATEWGPMPVGTEADDPSALSALADGLESIVGNENAKLAAVIIRRMASAPEVGEAQPVAYRAWFDQDNGARWLFTLWPEEERLDVQWEPLYAAPQARPSDDELWDQTLTERDEYHDIADKLANAIADHLLVEIGEHSSGNCPWMRALEAIENAAPQASEAVRKVAGVTLDGCLETLFRVGEHLGINYAESRKQPGAPSGVYIKAIEDRVSQARDTALEEAAKLMDQTSRSTGATLIRAALSAQPGPQEDGCK